LVFKLFAMWKHFLKHCFMLLLQRSDSSVAELAKTVVEKKQVLDIVGWLCFVSACSWAMKFIMESHICMLILSTWEKIWLGKICCCRGHTENHQMHYSCFFPMNQNPQCILNCTLSFQVAPYCASKWAIEGLTRSLAKELPPGLAALCCFTAHIDYKHSIPLWRY
jgi:NAD(P)-dependent dehydrogenase (short-subunit alcohol dehydrogenase family)